MQAKREYRDREDTQVAVLDALVERHEEGLTVFELRSLVNDSIDSIEDALGELKEEDLIEVDNQGERTLIYPDDRVVPEPGADDPDPSLVDRVRERLGL